jgi:TPP-dependent pyruvate/acetoin dehydrogenase alpha subunit
MGSAVEHIYRDLQDVDVFRDLEGRALRVAADGVSWNALPDIDSFPQFQVLDFYYHMALTRAVDNEIVKLSRHGLAFGKHLVCTGNEATTVGACSALRHSDWVTLAMSTV